MVDFPLRTLDAKIGLIQIRASGIREPRTSSVGLGLPSDNSFLWLD